MPARSDVTSTSRRRVGIGWVPAQTVVRAAPALLAAVVVCAPRAALLTHRAGISTSSRVTYAGGAVGNPWYYYAQQGA